MAIRDALWACPACGHFGSIRTIGKDEICARCDAHFERSHGARIAVRLPDGSQLEYTVPDWEGRLPPIDEPPPGGVLGPQQAHIRWATPPRPVRARGTFIGWAERFARPLAVTVSLEPTRLVARDENGREWVWPLEQITAVQPSSAALQVVGAGHPLVSFRFAEDSVRRWEALLHRFIRLHCLDAGRGDIIEFHPRIRHA